MARIDLKLDQESGIYDLALDSNGDLQTVENLETALDVSILVDARADSSEVEDPLKRRGWWGDVVSYFQNHNIGSKLWLFDQSRADGSTASRVENYVRQSLNWIEEQNIGKIESVTAENNRGNITFLVEARSNDNSIVSRYYELWRGL